MRVPVSKCALRFFLCFAAAGLLVSVLPHCSTADNNEKDFSLSVRLKDPFNSDFEVCFPVTVNKSFRVTWVNRGIKSSFSGMLRPAVDGKYPLTLAISEWESERSNSKEAGEHKLKPDQPEEWAFVQSVAYERTVLISKGGCSN